MARTIAKLTALAVSREKRPGYYGDCGGLYLQVSPGGAKSWVFRFKVEGRTGRWGLAPCMPFLSPRLGTPPPNAAG